MSLLHQALDRWAERQPDALFALEAGRQLSYAEAAAATRRIAAGLCSADLPPRARMAILAKNRIEVVLLYYAASRAGVTVVPLNTRLAADELAYIFGDAEPHVVFVDEPFVDVVDRLRAGQTLHAARFVALDPPAARRSGWESFETWLEHDPKAEAEPRLDPDGDLFQLYTSATTGRPKGAVLTQRAVCANIAQIGEAISEVAGARSLVVAPLFHAAMVPSTLAPLAQGGSVYVQSEFRPPEVVRVLDEERIGFAVLVPAMLLGILSGVPDLALRRFEALRLIYYGSSPIAEPTLRTAMDAFGCGFMQSYGMTEATQAVTFLTPEDHRRALGGHSDLLLSAGRPAPETEIEIVDAMNARLPAGGPGEVVVRGPQLMREYWRQPQATADTLRDGWLHSGDIGTLDAAGYLTIRDRLKDMIVSGGENVYPRAIEEVLAGHPAVAEAAVIGVPHPHWGETVKAIVVPRAALTLDGEELMAFCREHLGGFEVPRSVDIVQSLPRNAAGKVLKRVLREPYWTGQARQIAGA